MSWFCFRCELISYKCLCEVPSLKGERPWRKHSGVLLPLGAVERELDEADGLRAVLRVSEGES